MDFIVNNYLLTLILFTPTLGAVILFFLPGENKNLIRWAAFLLSFIPLALSLALWFQFDSTQAGFQFEQRAAWYPAINSSYHLGVDGISLTMVLLTTLLTPLSILASFGIQDRVKAFMMLFLFLETGMLGVFLALDLLLFFVFWEIGLVPMYFLINQWGSEKGERTVWGGRKMPARAYASFKFMIYTMAGSLGLLLAIQMIGVVSGTFDLTELYRIWPSLDKPLFGMSINVVKSIAFWAFTIAFALKVPVWPFHTWLPDAHTAAPTAGSVILAGVLLKMGTYGFVRFCLPLFPEASVQAVPVIATLAVIGILYGAWVSYGQDDAKKLVAYSSVSHLGFVMLGIFALNSAGIQGGVLQMFNHGVSTGALFIIVGNLYERRHTKALAAYGGIWKVKASVGTPERILVTSDINTEPAVISLSPTVDRIFFRTPRSVGAIVVAKR